MGIYGGIHNMNGMQQTWMNPFINKQQAGMGNTNGMQQIGMANSNGI